MLKYFDQSFLVLFIFLLCIIYSTDMDNVTLALSVSIAVVLVLLYSCWGKKPKKNKQSCNKPNPAHHDLPSSIQNKSDTGTGLKNAEARARYDTLRNNLTGYDDYGQVAQYMSLEPEVFESHDQYSNDMNRLSLGPSTMAERSDPNDVVPWVGLRRPDYKSTSASSGARVEHSEIPDQQYDQKVFSIGGADTYGF